MTVGQRIKARRQELDMTQEELAKKVGVSFQLISRYENNFVDTIPTKKLKLIANALQCSAYELMEGVKAEDDLTAQQLRLISLIKHATPDEVDKIEAVINLVMRYSLIIFCLHQREQAIAKKPSPKGGHLLKRGRRETPNQPYQLISCRIKPQRWQASERKRSTMCLLFLDRTL